MSKNKKEEKEFIPEAGMKDGERGEGKHTETPWEIAHYEDGILEGLNFIRGKDRAQICSIVGMDDRAKEDAEFIVKACNAYASNQATIRELVEALETCKTFVKHHHGDACFLYPVIEDAIEKVPKEMNKHAMPFLQINRSKSCPGE